MSAYREYRATLGNNVDNFSDSDIEAAFEAGRADVYREGMVAAAAICAPYTHGQWFMDAILAAASEPVKASTCKESLHVGKAKYISDLEEMRQGFRSVLDFCPLDEVQRISVRAYHRLANSRIVEMGGEDVPTPTRGEPAKVGEVCVWSPHADGLFYKVSCTDTFRGVMTCDGHKFCTFCGKPISVREG